MTGNAQLTRTTRCATRDAIEVFAVTTTTNLGAGTT